MDAARNWRLNAQRYRLIGLACPSCGAMAFPPRPTCPSCGLLFDPPQTWHAQHPAHLTGRPQPDPSTPVNIPIALPVGLGEPAVLAADCPNQRPAELR